MDEGEEKGQHSVCLSPFPVVARSSVGLQSLGSGGTVSYLSEEKVFLVRLGCQGRPVWEASKHQ